MKKRILLFTSLCMLGYIILSSNQFGPAVAGNNNCTGARGTSATCGLSGCHGSGAGPTVSITVDSGTTAVTRYKAGQTYKVHIHGSGTSRTWWGFEFASASGTGGSQTNAGTYGTAPAGLQVTNKLSFLHFYFVEHSQPLQSATAGSFDTSFTWIAPTTTGTGTISMYCTINAVDHNGNAGPGDVSGNKSIQLTELTNVSVNTILDNVGIQAYPNPVGNNLHIQMSNADAGTYTFNVFDITGRTIINQNTVISGNNYETNINTGNWAKGFYFLQIVKEDAQRTIQLVKE